MKTRETFGEIGDRVFNKLSHVYDNPTMKISDNVVRKNLRNKDSIEVTNSDDKFFMYAIENIIFRDKEMKPKTKNKNVTYSFNSLCVHDINWALIVADLTRKNPISLVTVPIEGMAEKLDKAKIAFRKMEREKYQALKKQCADNNEPVPERVVNKMPDVIKVANRYAVVHASLRAKAIICNIPLPEKGHDEKADVFKVSSTFAPWVKWAKKVKAAPWPKDLHNKVTVDILQPKI